jgi:osmotically-inducible protein OsmY
VRAPALTGVALGLAALLLGSSVGCGGGISSRPPIVRQSLSDAKITTNVKTFLLNDPQVGGQAIDVQVRDGIVTLSGIVRTAEDVARAEDLARHVAEVKDVKSALKVQP